MSALPRLLLPLLLAPALAGQQVVWERTGDLQLAFLHSVIEFGDLDGDGYIDLLIGAVDRTNRLLPDNHLQVLSGRDGRMLHRRSPPFDPSYPYQQLFWSWNRMGDVDGDGLPEYAATLRDFGSRRLPNEVLVYSAVQEQELWRVAGPWTDLFGEHIQGDVELDGDGRADLVVLAKRAGPLGTVYAYDSHGRRLYSVTVPGLLLRSLGKVGDVDGDGCDEFVIGALDATNRGAAVLVSGASGRTLRTGWGALAMDQIGFSVAGVGDVDRDGIPDFAAGSSATQGRGNFRVFSGATAQPLFTFADNFSAIGFSIAQGPLDADQDGIPDFAVGDGGSRVVVFSGRDGRELIRIVPDPGHTVTGLGWTVANLGVRPGDRYPVLGISEPNLTISITPTYIATRVQGVRTSHFGLRAVYGDPCSSTPALPRIGASSDGSSTRIMLSGAPPGVPALLALGLSDQQAFGLPLPLLLDPLGYSGCRLWTSVESILVTATGRAGLDLGYASRVLPQPMGWVGLDVFVQWLYLGPGSSDYGATAAHKLRLTR